MDRQRQNGTHPGEKNNNGSKCTGKENGIWRNDQGFERWIRSKMYESWFNDTIRLLLHTPVSLFKGLLYIVSVATVLSVSVFGKATSAALSAVERFSNRGIPFGSFNCGERFGWFLPQCCNAPLPDPVLWTFHHAYRVRWVQHFSVMLL